MSAKLHATGLAARAPYYYALRNYIVDFLVSRSKTFAADMPSHDPRNVPVVKIGVSEPTIVAAPRAVETHSAQTIAR